MRGYYTKPFVFNMEIIEEINRFLESYILQLLNEEEVKKLIKLITHTKTNCKSNFESSQE